MSGHTFWGVLTFMFGIALMLAASLAVPNNAQGVLISCALVGLVAGSILIAKNRS